MKTLSVAAIAALLASGAAVQPAAAHCRCVCPTHHRHAVHRKPVRYVRAPRAVLSEPVEIIRGPVAPGPYYETPLFEPPVYEAAPPPVYEDAYDAPVWYGGYGWYGGGPRWRGGWGHGFHAGFRHGFRGHGFGFRGHGFAHGGPGAAARGWGGHGGGHH